MITKLHQGPRNVDFEMILGLKGMRNSGESRKKFTKGEMDKDRGQVHVKVEVALNQI